VSKWAKRILFTLTGFAMYYPVGMIVNAMIERICVPIGNTHFCTGVWLVMTVIAIIGLCTGLSILEFHRCGKWLWLLIVPSWRTP
jgi:hypothetical protein